MATSLTRSEARALARLRIRDTSTVNPGISDANLNLLIEEARQFYASLFPEQFVRNLGTFASTASQIAFQATIAAGNVEWREITSVYLVGSATPTTYRPMRFANALEEILEAQRLDPAEDEPRDVLVMRSNGSDTVLDVFTWPIPDAIYSFQIWGRYEPALLTADGDALLFGFHGSRVVARIAALTAARVIGRPEDFVRGIEAELPDRVATRLREDLHFRKPLAYEGKARA